MTDSNYVRKLIQLAYDRTDLTATEFAGIIEVESQRYRDDPKSASDPTRIPGDTTPSRGQFAPAEDCNVTLDEFAGDVQ